MVKNTIKILALAVLAVTAIGCSTTSEKKVGNIAIRRYVEDRPRVDQELSGNSGFVYGTPQLEDKDRKETRRLYYVEFSKETPGQNIEIEEKDYLLPEPKARTPQKRDRSSLEESAPAVAKTTKTSKAKPVYYGYSEPAAEAYEAQAVVAESAVSAAKSVADVSLPQEYKIQENDTLQKISQKFYGSYGKWTKIYDANKEKLTDPNRIIPGKTITIPAL